MTSNKPPKKGSSTWKKNEKLIAKNPLLRQVRDTAEGFKPGSGISNAGDISEQYKSNYDKIDFKGVRTEKKNYRVKINGKYVDDD